MTKDNVEYLDKKPPPKTIYIYYNKTRRKSGDPLVVSNGNSVIFCSRISAININFTFELDNAPKIADRTGSSSVLAIPIWGEEGDEYDD